MGTTMRPLILAAALFGAATVPSLAQDAAPDPATMTCEAFLALDGAGQMQAMLALRAASNGDPAPAASTEAAASADPKLTAMRTSCEGVPEALAHDAMIAGHADYE